MLYNKKKVSTPKEKREILDTDTSKLNYLSQTI